MEEEKVKRGRYGGRAKGTPNRITSDLRKAVSEILQDGVEEFKSKMSDLEPYDYCRIYVSLLRYSIPTISTIEFATGAATSSVLEKLKEIDKESENENE